MKPTVPHNNDEHTDSIEEYHALIEELGYADYSNDDEEINK